MALTPVQIERAIEHAIGERPSGSRSQLFDALKRGRIVVVRAPDLSYYEASYEGDVIVRIPDDGVE